MLLFNHIQSSSGNHTAKLILLPLRWSVPVFITIQNCLQFGLSTLTHDFRFETVCSVCHTLSHHNQHHPLLFSYRMEHTFNWAMELTAHTLAGQADRYKTHGGWPTNKSAAATWCNEAANNLPFSMPRLVNQLVWMELTVASIAPSTTVTCTHIWFLSERTRSLALSLSKHHNHSIYSSGTSKITNYENRFFSPPNE